MPSTPLPSLALLLATTALAGCVVPGGIDGRVVSDGSCPGHWHSSFHVYVFDQRVEYGSDDHYTLESQVLAFSRHMHAGEGGQQIHWEPAQALCQRMGAFLEDVETSMTTSSLSLDGHHAHLGQAGAHRVGDPVPGTHATATLKVYIQTPAQAEGAQFDGQYEDWREMDVIAFLDRQPLNGEKQLIVFGAPDQADLKRMQEAVPIPPASGFFTQH